MAIVGLGTSTSGGHVVFALRGELDVAGAAGVIAALTAAAAGNPRIVVDLAALEYIDCYSLGALGRVRAQARQAGGDLLLAAPRGLVRRLLDLTGLIGVFAVHASAADAAAEGGPAAIGVEAGGEPLVTGPPAGPRRQPDRGVPPQQMTRKGEPSMSPARKPPRPC